MKKSLRLLAALLALCMIAAAGPPAGLAADADDPQASAIDLEQLVQEAAPGSTITLTGNARIEPSVSPWIISKDITIDGGGHTVSVYGTGILLGGNVTFSNMALGLHSADGRNAIIANGHALTLDNVTADELAVNLFCGTLIPAEYEKDKFTVPQPGGAGSITILGKTNLQGPNTASLGTANIFAGSLAMGSFIVGVGTEGDGPANEFAGDAAIRVEDSAGSGALGTIYAGGAQQRMPIGQQSGKVTSPNPRAYTVSGTVSISGAAIPDVDGAGSGATHVAYQGGAYEATRNFEHISSLSVESGRLVLDSWSTFREDGALFLSGGAKLDLKKFDGTDIPVQTFTGQGGTLLLKETQTWTVKGRAEGAAKVAVGDTNFDGSQSTTVPTEGHTYIRTPSGSAAAFQLLPHSRYPDMKLVQDAGGSWKASNSSPGGGVNRVTSFRIVEDTAAATVGEETCIAMEAEFESTDLPTLDFIPLSILVDGRTLNPVPDAVNEGYYTYTTMLGKLFMSATSCVSRPTARIPRDNTRFKSAFPPNITGRAEPSPIPSPSPSRTAARRPPPRWWSRSRRQRRACATPAWSRPAWRREPATPSPATRASMWAATPPPPPWSPAISGRTRPRRKSASNGASARPSRLLPPACPPPPPPRPAAPTGRS